MQSRFYLGEVGNGAAMKLYGEVTILSHQTLD